MLFTDILEIKRVLEIDKDDKSEDTKLNFINTWISAWFEEWLGRPGTSYKSRTEYYQGTGTQKLLLRSRPVRTTPAIQVYVDQGGYWGATSGAFTATNSQLTYGTDFALQIDQEDGTSRSAILWRIGNYWPKPSVRQIGLLSPFIGQDTGSIKVIYSGGWTIDNMPAQLRMAANLAVARLRYVLPLGLELSSESYEERHISISAIHKDWLFGMIRPFLWTWRNHKW